MRKQKLENLVVVRQELRELLALVNYDNNNTGNVHMTCP